MSTRCNLVIQSGDSRIYIYRHSDGYLAEAGKDLYNKLVQAGSNADKFLRSVLAEQYEATSYKPAQPVYELTDSVHGDIEYLYFVRFDRNASQAPVISWAQYKPGDDRPRRVNDVRGQELEIFRESVNQAIGLQNLRLEELKAGDNGKYWAQFEPAALLPEQVAA